MESEATYRGTVYPWHCDHVGHMNIMWYAGKFVASSADLQITTTNRCSPQQIQFWVSHAAKFGRSHLHR